MRRRALLLSLLLATACGGGSNSGTAAAPKSSATSESPAPSSCQAAPAALLAAIAEGEETGVGGLKLSGGQTYKSPDFSSVYFIAARITAPGVSGQVGVWASNSLTPGGGLILAVDGFAKQFTVWPDADKSAAKIGVGDPGVAAVKKCL